MQVTSRISVFAVTVVLLRKVVLPLPCQGVLRSLSAYSHVVPVIGAAEACQHRAAASAFQHLHAGGGSELLFFKSSHSLRKPEYL